MTLEHLNTDWDHQSNIICVIIPLYRGGGFSWQAIINQFVVKICFCVISIVSLYMSYMRIKIVSISMVNFISHQIFFFWKSRRTLISAWHLEVMKQKHLKNACFVDAWWHLMMLDEYDDAWWGLMSLGDTWWCLMTLDLRCFETSVTDE